MEIGFVGQPFADAGNLRDFVTTAADDLRMHRLSVLSAWAKYSGLVRVKDALEAFRSRGGESRLIVGIDEGGATEQGLRLALELFDSVHVLFDRSGRTFHPKVYLFDGDDAARLFAGSNNLTAGGVFYNYEGAIQCLLDLTTGTERKIVDETLRYFDRLSGDSGVCTQLDADLLAQLVADPRYRIGDERARRRAPTGTPADDVDTRLELDQPTPLFESSNEAKRSVPASGDGSVSVPAPVAIPPVPQPAAPVMSVGVGVEKRWYRKLSASDAQQPPGALTSPTGVVRLNQAGHAIDQTSYFRHDFFGNLHWTSEASPRGPKEATSVSIRVTINGNDLGPFELVVDHADYREAGQGNVTTVLHWGPLNPAMRAEDYADNYLVLERLPEGCFNLEITSTEPSGFLA